MSSYSIDRLIPQRDPIQMIDRMVEASDGKAITSFTIRPNNIFLSPNGRLDEVALIENIAQSASAMAGLQAINNGATEPPIGYIGEIKHFQCFSLPYIGDELLTEVEMGTEVAGVTLVKGQTIVKGKVIAATSMKIFIPHEKPNQTKIWNEEDISTLQLKGIKDLTDSYFVVNSIIHSENKATMHLALKPNSPVYMGHFPNNPVCPGVCNILMIKCCSQEIAKRALHFSSIKQCRLTAVASPLRQSMLETMLELTPTTIGYSLTATLADSTQTFMTLKGELI